MNVKKNLIFLKEYDGMDRIIKKNKNRKVI